MEFSVAEVCESALEERRKVARIKRKQDDKPEMLSPAQLAKRFNVTTRAIRKWEAEGVFPPGIRLGTRTVRWFPEVVEEWIAEQKAAHEAKQTAPKECEPS